MSATPPKSSTTQDAGSTPGPVYRPRSPMKPSRSDVESLQAAERTNYYIQNAVGFAFADQTNGLGITTFLEKCIETLSGKRLLALAKESTGNGGVKEAAKTMAEKVTQLAPTATQKATESVVQTAVESTATEAAMEAAEQCIGNACSTIGAESISSTATSETLTAATTAAVHEGIDTAAKTSGLFSSVYESTSGCITSLAGRIWENKFRIGVAVVWGIAHSKTQKIAAHHFPEMNENVRTAGSLVLTGVAIWTASAAVWYVTGFGGIGAIEMVTMGASTVFANALWNGAGKAYHAFAATRFPAKWSSLPSWRLGYSQENAGVAKRLTFD